MRILLVDDETRLLDSTRRAIRLERPSWAVFTASGGVEAIQVLQERSIDVLVTDMLMPGMDGAGVLRMARQLSPGTVRLILSGHAGRDLIQSCEGSFHQFLGKPVDPEAFIRVMDSFLIDEASPMTTAARRLVAGLERVPSLPTLYRDLAQQLNEPSPSMEEVSRIVQLDLGMASKVLKLANSCYVTSGLKINDLRQAVELLSLDVLRKAVLLHGALEVAWELNPSSLDLTELWSHSSDVGRAAATLARAEDQGPQIASTCYAAGLFHDIGRAVLARDPELAYQGVLDLAQEQRCPLTQVEQEAYGTDHAEVGGELLHLWGLDARLCQAVRSHHLPLASLEEDFTLRALSAADAWCSGTLSSNRFSDGGALDLGRLPEAYQRWASLLDSHRADVLTSAT